MVYRGKPSTGCQNCRARHIKCDESRPHCRACVRTGRSCPGYPHPLDVMLRRQTAFDRKKRNAPSNTGLSSTANNHKGAEDISRTPTPSDMSLSRTSTPSTISPKYPLLSEIKSSGVPHSLYFPLEDTVTSLFFNSYLYLPKDPLIRDGFMELLPESYSKTTPGSHLHLSALAVSFFSVAAWTGNSSLLRSAEHFFVKAISKTRIALQEDIDENSDEILMTILLLSTYEEFAAIKDKRLPARAHLRGAIALINSKGDRQLNSTYTSTMTNSVQTQIIKTSMLARPPLVQTPNVWPLSPLVPQSPSSQLISATSELVNLRRAWNLATITPGTYNIADISNIYARAIDFDRHLSPWEHVVPEYWKPMPASIVPDSVRAAGAYRGRCDCYADQWIASMWNFYRESRLVIQNIILNCLRLLPETNDTPERIQSMIAQIRDIATDICATVPFFLGSQKDSIHSNPSTIHYPETETRRTTQAHKQAAPLLGGWFVMFHLMNLCSPELCLPEEQLAWIGQQIQRVHRIYNLDIYNGGMVV
ncbi:C6 zinc finger domain protein [Aspergillus ambiguus]|uniref:Zn(II)2Cys6 transcription factor n=1 Tax=Aspergillus ambiguus TaxID=176160 RepID=UPI003CCE4324